MSDQIRETRRRRILENSEARYQRILGLSKAAPVSEETSEEFKLPTIPRPAMPLEVVPQPASLEAKAPILLECVENQVPQIRQRTLASHEAEAITEPTRTSVKNFMTNEKISPGQNILEQAPDVGRNNSLRILVFTAITTITLLFLNYGQLFGNNVFLPFVVYEIFSVMLSKEENDQPGTLINMVLMLLRLPREQVLQLAKILVRCQQIFQDFCVYIFFVVICLQIFKLNA